MLTTPHRKKYRVSKHSLTKPRTGTDIEGQVADACECGNEPSGSIKCGEFVD